MSGAGWGIYFVIFAAVAIAVGVYTANRRSSAAGTLWGVLVFFFGALGLIAWAIYFGLTARRSGPPA